MPRRTKPTMKEMKSLVCQLALVAIVYILTAPGAAAFVTDTPSAEANAAYEAKDWARAAARYEELSKEKDAPPRVWLRLGASLRSLGKYEEALAAFDKATQMGAGQFGEYGKGATYAAMKQSDKAFEALDKAMLQG